MMLECDPQKPFRKLQLAITSEDGGEHHRVLPTHFLLTEDGKQVLNYKVTERPAPDAMSVIFVFPRNGVPGSSAWTRGALSCRGWKRTSDMWAVQTYTASQSAEEDDVASAEDALPRYSANPETITAALSTPPPRSRAWICGGRCGISCGPTSRRRGDAGISFCSATSRRIARPATGC